jgi:hypothetical protein
LPLDHPGWLAIGEAHRLLALAIGDDRLAAIRLTDELRRGGIRCRIRSHNDGKRAIAPASLWSGHELRRRPDGVFVCPRLSRSDGDAVPVRGYSFHVWRPDFERRWPAAKV